MNFEILNQKLSFLSPVKGDEGQTEALLPNGKKVLVRYRKDSQGFWIETPSGTFGYDVRKFTDDEGQSRFTLIERQGGRILQDVAVLKPGESSALGASAGGKAKVRVKSQMPGKILRVSVKPGDRVEKGQSVLVMEAMKMENDMKAQITGIVKDVKVTPGQTIETGTVLFELEKSE